MDVVAAPVVCHHHTIIVPGNHSLHFLTARQGADLMDCGRVGLERQQVGGLAPNATARVISLYDGLGWYHSLSLRVGRTDGVGGAPYAILRDHPLRQCHPCHHGHLAHWHAPPVVQSVCRCHGSPI
jgi:hypothetical protein